MRVGTLVRAAKRVAEVGFNGPGVWVHATKGELGRVVHVDDPEWLTVQFERTGTATLVHTSEVQPATR
jgi:hypothetical protein